MALAAAPDITGFRALSPLGYGPTSTIYSAQGDALGRWVALTVYSTALPNERAQRRFERAFEIARRLGTHPNAVTMIESGLTFERQPYVVTEIYERGTLQSRIEGRQLLSVDEALHIGVLLAGALETAHRADVIHGGIHPARVLLSDDGEPALADLGLVPLVDRGGLAALVSPISFHSAPEVLEAGALSPATDVYALASTLYAALAGRGPYQRDAEDTTAGLLVRILQHDVPPLGRGDVPGSLDKALRGALRCDPASRPGRMLAFARELQACQKELGLPVTEPVVLDVAASIRLAGSAAAAAEPRLSMAPVVEPAPPSSNPPQRVFVPAPDEIPDPAVSAPMPVVPASAVPPSQLDVAAPVAGAAASVFPPVAPLAAAASPVLPPPPGVAPLPAPVPEPPAGGSPWGRNDAPFPGAAATAAPTDAPPVSGDGWASPAPAASGDAWASPAPPTSGDGWASPAPESPWDRRVEPEPAEAEPWNRSGTPGPVSPWEARVASPEAEDEPWNRSQTPGPAGPAASEASPWDAPAAPEPASPWNRSGDTQPAPDDTPRSRNGEAAMAAKDAPWSREALSASGPPPDDPAAIWTPGPLPTGATPKIPDDVAAAPSSDTHVTPGASVWSPNEASDAAEAPTWNRNGSSEPEAAPADPAGAPDAEPEAPSWAAGGAAARVGDSAWGPVRGPESSSTLDLGSSGAAPAPPGRRTPPAPTPPAPGESPWPALAGRADPPPDGPDDHAPFGAPRSPGPADDPSPFGQPQTRGPADGLPPFGAPQPPGPGDDLPLFGAPRIPRPADDLSPFGAPPLPGPGPSDDRAPFGAPRLPEPADDLSPFGAPPLPGPGPSDDLSPFGQPQAGRPEGIGFGGLHSAQTGNRSGPLNGRAEGQAGLPGLHAGSTQDRSGFGGPQNDVPPVRSGPAGPLNGTAHGQAPGLPAGQTQRRALPGGAPQRVGADDDGSPFAGVQALDLRPRVEPEAQFHAGLRIERAPADHDTRAHDERHDTQAQAPPHDETDGAPPMGTAARALPVIVLVALVVVLGAGLAWAVTTHDPTERDRAASVDGVDPSNDPPSADDVVHVDVTAVENPSGVQLDWDGGADGEQVVLVLSETEEPRLLEASTGTALLVPGNSLTADTGYCFVVTTTSGPPPTPALIASDLPEDALSPAGCIRGASPTSVRR